MLVAADLAVSLIATWAVGLAPALVARYVWKKRPLSAWHATLIAGISCALFAVAFLIIRSALGEADARISPAWILVFLVSRAVMMSGKRADLVRRLQAMIAHPATTEEHRALATEKLGQLNKITARRSRTPNGAIAGGPSVERGQPDGHRQRLGRRGDESGSVEGGNFAPARARMQRFGRAAAYTFGCVLLLDALLVISGYRVLIYENIVKPGESYDSEWGTLRHSERTFIVCRYWTGRKAISWVQWYGIDKHQIDECRFIFDPDEAA